MKILYSVSNPTLINILSNCFLIFKIRQEGKRKNSCPLHLGNIELDKLVTHQWNIPREYTPEKSPSPNITDFCFSAVNINLVNKTIFVPWYIQTLSLLECQKKEPLCIQNMMWFMWSLEVWHLPYTMINRCSSIERSKTAIKELLVLVYVVNENVRFVEKQVSRYGVNKPVTCVYKSCTAYWGLEPLSREVQV